MEKPPRVRAKDPEAQSGDSSRIAVKHAVQSLTHFRQFVLRDVARRMKGVESLADLGSVQQGQPM
ncbi:MAG: hypothetical protein HYT87_11775 [Nitrospirae bacterium]|nr:hypothetical protein [Nitrospirota bacterium]